MQQFDLIAQLKRQRAFSLGAFGPGNRTAGVLDHISKEIEEVRQNPDDPMEWIDIILLAFDGAWRSGMSPQDIAENLDFKQSINETREWPDWRKVDPNKAIEHVKPTKESE